MTTPFEAPLAQAPEGRKFGEMSGAQKALFLAKLAACIVTFGYAFPNVQHD